MLCDGLEISKVVHHYLCTTRLDSGTWVSAVKVFGSS